VELLVIGGSGCLGRRLVDLALAGGHRVVATFHTQVPPAAGADWRGLDIRDRDAKPVRPAPPVRLRQAGVQ
jgi:dTDP-4-dehydrorhamnose reductase